MAKFYVESGPIRLIFDAATAEEAAVKAFQWTCDKQAEIQAESPLDHMLEAEERGWQLPHYFFEFDIYDKEIEAFLDLERRLDLLAGAGIETVPVIHSGALKRSELEALIGPSKFDSQFENPLTHRTDNLMEGLYLRTESDGIVTGRAKFVRFEFVEKIKQSTHWQHQAMVPNQLADGVNIWS